MAIVTASIPSNTAPLPASILLSQATEVDLPALINLQFQCFNATILIEQIANPDTPANRASMLERHRQHMQNDAGLKVIKAVMKPSQSPPAHSNAEGSTVDSATNNNDNDQEILAGFCMFYIPTRSLANPLEVILPTPLRNWTSTTAVGQTTDNGGVATATATAKTTISVSRTNIPTFRPHRHALLEHLTTERSPARISGAGYVRYMCVHPAYRRLGIGRKLMEWGCNWFDEEGVDVYLEATAEGEPLYGRFGFEKVGEQTLEVDGVLQERYACMWRPTRRTLG